MRRLRDGIARRGFVAVLYARIAPGMPFTLVNYASGLTAVRLLVFAAATALGAAPRAFAYAALGGSLDDLRLARGDRRRSARARRRWRLGLARCAARSDSSGSEQLVVPGRPPAGPP